MIDFNPINKRFKILSQRYPTHFFNYRKSILLDVVIDNLDNISDDKTDDIVNEYEVYNVDFDYYFGRNKC